MANVKMSSGIRVKEDDVFKICFSLSWKTIESIFNLGPNCFEHPNQTTCTYLWCELTFSSLLNVEKRDPYYDSVTSKIVLFVLKVKLLGIVLF